MLTTKSNQNLQRICIFSGEEGIEFNNVNITQPFGVYFPIHLYPQVGLTSLQAPMGRGWVKSLDNGWSKSIILENKVVLNFDFF